ncbi:MAG: DsbA family protein [Actinomycetia bacterium]|nr:DsbA family protein [Actinomycetes bacterium]
MSDDLDAIRSRRLLADPGGEFDPEPDLTRLLSNRRSSAISVWVDPISPATGLFLPYLDIDGHSNGGRPWRFRGHHEVQLRLLPDPNDELSGLVARCIVAVRAWAVLRGAGDKLVPMDYDVPWGYLFHLQRDLLTLRQLGLPHLVATAGRDGDWLGNWVSQYFDAPEVHEAVAKDMATARALTISEAPTVMVGGTVFRAEEMPDDIDAQVEALLV